MDAVKAGDIRILTMGEFAQDVERHVEEINETRIPVMITNHGRFVAIVRPLASGQDPSRIVEPRREHQGQRSADA